MKHLSDRKNYKLIIGSLCLLICALLFNHWTPYASDDYSYMFNFSDGSRITSLGQIFQSLAEHYMHYGNGRIISHFFVMLFLIGSKSVFNIVNAVFFVLFVISIYKVTSRNKKFSLLLFFAIPTLLWLYMPAYGQIFLWLDGSINYMWSYLFALTYLFVYIGLIRNRILLDKKWKMILFCIFTFLFGNYSENVSFSVIFIGFILLCIVMYQRKKWKSYFIYVLPVVCGAIGYLLLLLSPSGSAKFSENLSLPLIFKNAVEIFTEYYNTCRIPLIFFFVLLGIALYYKLDKKEILIALAFFFISVIASGMLVIASYLPERSLANGIVFLIIGIVQLLQLLRSNTRLECVSLCVCIYLIVGSLMSYWEGSYDIYRVHKEQAVRDTTIESAVSAGDTVIGVPIITSTTKYCCKYGLLDMNGKDSDDPFPNAYIAKYYGLDKIYVIYPDNSGQ